MAVDVVNAQNERTEAVAVAEADLSDDDGIARTVAQVWQTVLQTPVSGPEDDFFEVGGDSLKAITFMIDLEQALGLELSLTLIAEAPKFGSLCEALREHRTSSLRSARSAESGQRTYRRSSSSTASAGASRDSSR
jgi:acyl carrier protein